MESPYAYTRGGRQQPSLTPPSPRLLRSRSGSSTSETHTCRNSSTIFNQRFNTNRSKSTTRSSRSLSYEEHVNPSSISTISNQRVNTNRSKSTTRSSRNFSDEENVNPSSIINSKKSKEDINKDGFVRFLQRDAAKKTKSVTSSPSAWALSPGHSLPYLAPSELPARKVKSSGGVSGVLKYFRQKKKVSPVQGEEYHKFRIMHNRLLQYRIANARAQASTASSRNAAEAKIFSVRLRVLKMRNLITEKQIEVEKLKHEIKLCQILNPQIRLLNEWAKLEGKNCQAVGRVVRKLSAISVKLPFEDDYIKADVKAIYEAMSMATRVMNDIEATIFKFLPQAERILYMLTELISTMELEEECLEELDTTVASIPSLTETEKYLRVRIIQAQAAHESKEN
ncbi:QWRF motif-containing protein 7-like [Melia azedarach]|uniref:QWRF motif-containing protein 7-like n=1 Tax=Melia azedarach TaxID=155640 RepID=A0ACC1X6A1_MELAZ|nr:QWRF motif-containing protein 7-like [Melia azedarach]